MHMKRWRLVENLKTTLLTHPYRNPVNWHHLRPPDSSRVTLPLTWKNLKDYLHWKSRLLKSKEGSNSRMNRSFREDGRLQDRVIMTFFEKMVINNLWTFINGFFCHFGRIWCDGHQKVVTSVSDGNSWCCWCCLCKNCNLIYGVC
jgi:hypothetical protein